MFFKAHGVEADVAVASDLSIVTYYAKLDILLIVVDVGAGNPTATRFGKLAH